MNHSHRRHRFMHFYFSEIMRALLEPIFIFLTIVSAAINFLGALAFYLVEKNHNEKLLSFFDALYFAVTTTTGVGYGDISPATFPGKIVSMGMMLLGTALFAAFTATLATTLMELELKRRSLHQG